MPGPFSMEGKEEKNYYDWFETSTQNETNSDLGYDSVI